VFNSQKPEKTGLEFRLIFTCKPIYLLCIFYLENWTINLKRISKFQWNSSPTTYEFVYLVHFAALLPSLFRCTVLFLLTSDKASTKSVLLPRTLSKWSVWKWDWCHSKQLNRFSLVGCGQCASVFQSRIAKCTLLSRLPYWISVKLILATIFCMCNKYYYMLALSILFWTYINNNVCWTVTPKKHTNKHNFIFDYNCCVSLSIFTARRIYAIAVLVIVILSICPSVTRVLCDEMK